MADRLLPNWLEAYLVYTADSESPEEYHLWSGISAIAGVLRRRVFFDMGYFILYPNMYIVLVGPAGRCKKSTAMRLGRNILSSVQGIELTTDSVTRERLIQDLSQAYKDGQSAMTAYSSEFASLLTSSGMDMVVFLIDIFDCPPEWTHKTKSGGTNKITAPYLNLQAATTPDWISKAMPLDTVGIGLTSRIVFVFQDTPREAESIPELSPAQIKIQEMLKHDLSLISTIGGEFKFAGGKGKRGEADKSNYDSWVIPPGEAYRVYDSWSRARLKSPNPTGDPRLNGYFERKPMHLLKLAMIMSAARKDSLELTMDDIQLAMHTLSKVEERMPAVFANVGKNPINADRTEVYNAIVTSGGMTLGQLHEKFGYSLRKDEMAEVLDTLMVIGKITNGPKGGFIPVEKRNAKDIAENS